MGRRVDVALYLPSLRGGGAERILLALGNAFVDAGLRVDLVLACSEGPYLKDVSPSLNVIDLGSRRVFASLPALVGYLRRNRPRSVLSALSHANVVAILARMISRVSTRLVVSERGHVSALVQDQSGCRYKILYGLMRRVYKNADAVVAISDGVAKDLVKSVGISMEKIEVIYNPAVTPLVLAGMGESLDHSWMLMGNCPIVLGAGRLVPEKDFPTLIRAFSLVRRHRDCRLVILGEGGLRESLERLVNSLGLDNEVLLPGFVDNPFSWMKRSSVFVLSSRWEGFGNVLVEAMACGVPVVSTDCPSGPAEILEGGRWGSLVPIGDPAAMAEAICHCLAGRSQGDPRVRAADFHINSVARRYLDVLGISVDC